MDIFRILKRIAPFYHPREGWMTRGTIHAYQEWTTNECDYIQTTFGATFSVSSSGDKCMVYLPSSYASCQMETLARSFQVGECHEREDRFGTGRHDLHPAVR